MIRRAERGWEGESQSDGKKNKERTSGWRWERRGRGVKNGGNADLWSDIFLSGGRNVSSPRSHLI